MNHQDNRTLTGSCCFIRAYLVKHGSNCPKHVQINSYNLSQSCNHYQPTNHQPSNKSTNRPTNHISINSVFRLLVNPANLLSNKNHQQEFTHSQTCFTLRQYLPSLSNKYQSIQSWSNLPTSTSVPAPGYEQGECLPQAENRVMPAQGKQQGECLPRAENRVSAYPGLITGRAPLHH